MCGIFGFARFRGGKLDAGAGEKVAEIIELMRLRGPDGNGSARGESWIFGHTRLAVIDPASGKQPWTDAASGCVLIYNGELFNHKDLRSGLESGFAFRSSCDTETVMAAYLKWGAACVERFNGFFSLAVFDPRSNSIFAARDRTGVKPFYYSLTADDFCFCSMVPGILRFKGTNPEPDLETLSNYLSFSRIVFGEKTIVKGVKSLLPGRRMTVSLDSGNVSVSQYWRRPVLTPEQKSDAPPFEKAAAETAELVEDAVRMRLMSDVPLGAFLSGGLDSSVIASLAARNSSFVLPVFCAGADGSPSEAQFAREAADKAGAALTELSVDAARFSEHWGFLTAQKGMPLCTPNEISIYMLSAELRKKCVVTLTGEGADEIYGGYVAPQFSAFDFDRCPRSQETSLQDNVFEILLAMQYGRSWFINDTDHYTATSAWMSYPEKRALFNESVWASLDDDNAMYSFYEDFFNGLEGCSAFDKRMHLYADLNLECLLSRVDNSSMSASVEARVPFNDYRLVERAFSMPDSYKMRWKGPKEEERGKDIPVIMIDKENLLSTKCLVREAFRSIVPESAANRPKMSFPVPFEKWFYGPLLGDIKDMCLSSETAGALFKKETLEAMFTSRDKNLWLVANLCKWFETMRVR